MLWTDRDFVTADDLLTLDSEVQEVADVSNITLDDAANGLIHRGLGECADSLMKQQQVFGGFLSQQTVSGNHYNAVMNVGLPAVNRQRVLVNQVVVSHYSGQDSQWSTLKTWCAYYALALFFRDAANRTLKDRYQEKADRYKKEARTTYFEPLKSMGLPITRNPLPCPGALYEPAVSGSFGSSNVALVTGNGVLTEGLDVAVTWVDGRYYQSPLVKVNAESALSPRVTVNPTGSTVLQINLAGLTAPNGNQHASTFPLGITPYGIASGWNVYVGIKTSTLFLQNASPIPVGTQTYTLAGDPALTGYSADAGQYPDLYFTFQKIIQRA